MYPSVSFPCNGLKPPLLETRFSLALESSTLTSGIDASLVRGRAPRQTPQVAAVLAPNSRQSDYGSCSFQRPASASADTAHDDESSSTMRTKRLNRAKDPSPREVPLSPDTVFEIHVWLYRAEQRRLAPQLTPVPGLNLPSRRKQPGTRKHHLSAPRYPGEAGRVAASSA